MDWFTLWVVFRNINKAPETNNEDVINLPDIDNNLINNLNNEINVEITKWKNCFFRQKFEKW